MSTINGVVIGLIGDKTVKVLTKKLLMHKLYRKIISRRTIYLCHNDLADISIGLNDAVTIKPCAPKSKRKSWAIVKKIAHI